MREIYFHEDDYCQQELLPREAAGFAGEELKKIQAFSEAHRAPGGLGWTDLYIQHEAPVELSTLKIDREELAEIVSAFLPPFDVVYSGYSSHREHCQRTAAWGRSQQCALFADWNHDGIVGHIWAEFFEQDEVSIVAATKAVATIGTTHPLIYVDWAWGYICEVSDEHSFSSKLRSKLETIAENTN
jgi:hypothetical protein